MTEEPERSSGAEENELSFTGELRKMNLNSVDEIEEEILDAKNRFEDARRKATEAFNNEVLTPLDRILAMGVRLMATILEKVDNPVSALDTCISGLNELHSMPFVTENFSVELEKGIKRKLEMGDFCLAWSFGQKDELEHQRLASATSIATNTLGQFLVVEEWGSCVKFFDASGKFLKSFNPSTKSGRLVAVATDQDDNIYVLENEKTPKSAKAFLQVFNNLAQFLDEFEVGFKLQAVTVKVMPSRLVLVPVHFAVGRDQSSPPWADYYVVLKNTKGRGTSFLSEKTLKDIRDIATADDLIMILDRKSTVFVFTDACVSDEDRPLSPFLKKFPVLGKVSAITFHPKSKHVIIVSQIEEQRWQLFFYRREGKFERSIDLDVERHYFITGAAVTTDGRFLAAVGKKREGACSVNVALLILTNSNVVESFLHL